MNLNLSHHFLKMSLKINKLSSLKESLQCYKLTKKMLLLKNLKFKSIKCKLDKIKLMDILLMSAKWSNSKNKLSETSSKDCKKKTSPKESLLDYLATDLNQSLKESKHYMKNHPLNKKVNHNSYFQVLHS